MQSRGIRAGVMFALGVTAVLVGGATDAYAQRKMTRLGSPATRFTAPTAAWFALVLNVLCSPATLEMGGVNRVPGLPSLVIWR